MSEDCCNCDESGGDDDEGGSDEDYDVDLVQCRP